ncbi:MAG TPA: hypothetical protein VH721_06780 [Gaiellaceae bacterium]
MALVVVPLVLTACGGNAVEEETGSSAVVEHVKGTKAERVRLTEEAAQRLDIHTTPVRSDGTRRLVIPYAAVLYDPDGTTWTYTNPSPLVYQRQDISVDRIDGDSVILSKGPPVGTAVVTVGATEIWGVEYGGIEED